MKEFYGSDKFHFIFLVDRSSSMNNFDRIERARDALTIFIRSLPFGCRFSILSFGSKFTWLQH